MAHIPECWEAGSIPGLAQWVRDLELPELWGSLELALDLIPGPGTPNAKGQPEKKKRKKKKKRKEEKKKKEDVKQNKQTKY